MHPRTRKVHKASLNKADLERAEWVTPATMEPKTFIGSTQSPQNRRLPALLPTRGGALRRRRATGAGGREVRPGGVVLVFVRRRVLDGVRFGRIGDSRGRLRAAEAERMNFAPGPAQENQLAAHARPGCACSCVRRSEGTTGTAVAVAEPATTPDPVGVRRINSYSRNWSTSSGAG